MIKKSEKSFKLCKVNLDNFNEEYSNIGMTIYEESCKINDADPDSSKVYRMIKDGV